MRRRWAELGPDGTAELNDIPLLWNYPYVLGKFYSKVWRRKLGCWYWMGLLSAQGYGLMAVGQTVFGAHRVSYRIHNGPVSGGLLVRHKCDNPRCVHPKHLELGTHQDNADDMVKRGRGSVVAQFARLSEEQKIKIKLEHAEGLSVIDLAARYGVVKSVILLVTGG